MQRPNFPNNHRPPPAINAYPRGPFSLPGIPSLSIQDNRQVLGDSSSTSLRSFTILRTLGDGSFGTVWLCDWHSSLPPNTPPAAMQLGNCRPEWVGKRLVALKRMKQQWNGGWDECQNLKELQSLRSIPVHPNIVILYDCFLTPIDKELYFAFEPMEGNLYHLIKSRKGRPLAGGLVSSIFRQIVSGLAHIHDSGYFHRDLKPENILVTTTGYHDYNSVLANTTSSISKERDVITIIKLADFGLARETRSQPPYTDYVSTRWYRAPEVLLHSRIYSNPVDMWALGTIMAEVVNLRPLFPGEQWMDQLHKICDVLGDPSDAYGIDNTKSAIGGGPWRRGIELATAAKLIFPKRPPRDISLLFDPSVPRSLIHCIRGLLRYDPDARLTSRQCIEHPYLLETTPRNPNIPNLVGLDSNVPSAPLHANSLHTSSSSLTPRNGHSQQLPQTHTHDATSSHRSGYYLVPQYPNGTDDRQSKRPSGWGELGSTAPNLHTHTNDYPMAAPPQAYHQNVHAQAGGYPTMSVQEALPIVSGHPAPSQPSKLSVFNSLPFGKKNKRSFGMFGGDKSSQLPPVEENVATAPTSLKRTQTSSTDEKSAHDMSPIHENSARLTDTKKMNKKEAERLQREAEEQRRKMAAKMHREQARAVMQKRSQVMQKAFGNDIEWEGGNEQRLGLSEPPPKGKQSTTGPIRQSQISVSKAGPSTTLSAAGGRFGNPTESGIDYRGSGAERISKARRREFDDDHSMSSSEVHSLGRLSSISFATVDSDPGPSRLRNRPSLFSINRMTSLSSLRTSVDDFPSSARSSNSFSLEGQLAHEFRTQASVNSPHLAGSVSPPPMHMLSLSPSVSPSLSPSTPWIQIQHHDGTRREQSPPYIALGQSMGYSYISKMQRNPTSPYGQPPSPLGLPPRSGNEPKLSINPMFKVPTTDSTNQHLHPSLTALPPFSQLQAVAEGESPPSFSPPEGTVA